MDEIRVDSIKIRQDLVGDFDKTNKLKGYKAECFLKRMLKEHEAIVLDYMQKKYGFSPYVRFLAHCYVKKYKSYLKDKDARKHIYEKYGEKQSITEILAARIIDLDAKECLRLKNLYESNWTIDVVPVLKVVDEIVKNYMSELRLLIPDDTTKTKNL